MGLCPEPRRSAGSESPLRFLQEAVELLFYIKNAPVEHFTVPQMRYMSSAVTNLRPGPTNFYTKVYRLLSFAIAI